MSTAPLRPSVTRNQRSFTWQHGDGMINRLLQRVAMLHASNGCYQVARMSIVGSYARGCPVLGDLDVLVELAPLIADPTLFAAYCVAWGATRGHSARKAGAVAQQHIYRVLRDRTARIHILHGTVLRYEAAIEIYPTDTRVDALSRHMPLTP